MPWDIATSIPEDHLLGWQILIGEYESGKTFDFTIDRRTGQPFGFPKEPSR